MGTGPLMCVMSILNGVVGGTVEIVLDVHPNFLSQRGCSF